MVDNLSKRLKYLMLQHGNLCEAELARETQVPQPTIHRLLSGDTKDPRVSTLRLVSDYFNVSIDYLLGKEPLLTSFDTNGRLSSNNRLLPIINWPQVLPYLRDPTPILETVSDAKSWTTTELFLGKNAFALPSRAFMEPRFPKGTLLIIDPDESPQDGDFILLCYAQEQQITLRNLLVDGNIKLLQPVFSNTPAEPFTEDKEVLGVVIQSKMTYHSVEI